MIAFFRNPTIADVQLDIILGIYSRVWIVKPPIWQGCF
jgi:hypothetical protein